MLNSFRMVLPALALVVTLPAVGAEDWQDRLAEAMKDMPSAQEMQDRRIVDSYINEIGSSFAGETEEQRAQNVLQFTRTRLQWLAACSLLYTKEQQGDDGWVAEYRMDMMRRHLGLFATAIVETIEESVTPDKLVATMMETMNTHEGPRFDQWLGSPEGKENPEYKRMAKACAKNLQTVMRLEQ